MKAPDIKPIALIPCNSGFRQTDLLAVSVKNFLYEGAPFCADSTTRRQNERPVQRLPSQVPAGVPKTSQVTTETKDSLHCIQTIVSKVLSRLAVEVRVDGASKQLRSLLACRRIGCETIDWGETHA